MPLANFYPRVSLSVSSAYNSADSCFCFNIRLIFFIAKNDAFKHHQRLKRRRSRTRNQQKPYNWVIANIFIWLTTLLLEVEGRADLVCLYSA